MADFFELQEHARKRTRLLVLLFLLAILCTVLAVDALVWVTLLTPESFTWIAWQDHLLSREGLTVSLTTLLVIAFGSLNTTRQVSKGGAYIAHLSGGTPVTADTQHPKERRLRNVVEEMAIASGTPAPSIFVMKNEAAINAFVAGTSPSDAVLVVTQGLLDTLNREELMGVIGHEFSHLLNGDMRLNLQLWGLLGGLFMLAQGGHLLIRSGSRISTNKKQGMQGAVVLIGLGLLTVGYLSLFFGRLIKAAVSRQREFLADASSVQFNRQSKGLVQALALIERNPDQGVLDSQQAEQLSHLCFAQPLRLWWNGMLATHPPIEQRIRHIWPEYQPHALERRLRLRNQKTTAEVSEAPKTSPQTFDIWDKAVVLGGLGQINDAQVEQAKKLKQAFPEQWWEKIGQNASHAKMAIYGLLRVAGDGAGPGRRTTARGGDSKASDAKAVEDAILRSDPLFRYNLAEHALHTLSRLGAPERLAFTQSCKGIAEQDGKIRFEEFFLLTLIRKRLQPASPRASHIRRLSHAAFPLSVLLCAACRLSGQNKTLAKQTYLTVWRRLALPEQPWRWTITLDDLDASLTTLSQLTPLLKKIVLQALLDCVQSDAKITVREFQLLQLTGAILDVPTPLPPISEH